MNHDFWQNVDDRKKLTSYQIGPREFSAGDRVRLRPRRRADIIDLALDGKIAIIEAIEQDFEGRVHLAVVIEDDPGRDLGLLRQVGHRFFFLPEEVEPLHSADEAEAAMNGDRVLIAGIGNIFHGDDAFGCEAVRRIAARGPMPGVRVVDYGIRAYDLAYAILGDWELVILVDATQRGGPPGTLYVIEPDLAALDDDSSPAPVEAHSMQPAHVLRLAKAFGGVFPKLLLIGCEPADLGDPEEGKMGLSEAVAAAVERTPGLVASLVEKHLRGDPPSAAETVSAGAADESGIALKEQGTVS